MKTVTILNQKGGVAKTTICRNLGALLAQKYNKKVLLIDLDSSGNLSNFFGLRMRSGDERGAAAVVADPDADPAAYIVQTRIEGLYLLPGNDMLGKVETEIKRDNMLPQQFLLKNQLEIVSEAFDYCLIDTPPTVDNSILVINALCCSDEVIIPCLSNVDSVDGVAHIVVMINKVQRFWNQKLTLRGVLFNKIANRRNIDKDILAQSGKMGVPRFRVYIRESIALAENSRAENKTFSEYDRRAREKATRDMENLAAEFVGANYPYPDDVPELPGEYL